MYGSRFVDELTSVIGVLVSIEDKVRRIQIIHLIVVQIDLIFLVKLYHSHCPAPPVRVLRNVKIREIRYVGIARKINPVRVARRVIELPDRVNTTARAKNKRVIATPAKKPVIARTTNDRVRPVSARDDIYTVTAVQKVVTPTADHPVIACTAIHHVIT